MIALLGASALSSHTAFAAKLNVKCGKDAYEVEMLICQDEELARLDVSLTSLYLTVLKNTPSAQKRQLRAEQSGWVKGRNDCWKAADQRTCVKGGYETRIKELKDR